MSRYARLCAVAPRDFVLDASRPMRESVELMIKIWDDALAIPLAEKPDLILLPEACDRPENFGREDRLAFYEARGEAIYEHFREMARAHNVNIGYSAAWRQDDGSYANATRFIDRDGELAGVYRKNHLVVPSEPSMGMRFGVEADPIRLDFGTVGGVICFDLNFNELRARYKANPPDILAFSSMFHGGFMQQFWAYDVRAYFLGAVPMGRGGCSLISPAGEVIAQAKNHWPFIVEDVNLDCATIHLTHNRARLDEARRKYGHKLRVMDPGLTGAVTVCCEADDMTIGDAFREFEIEPLDDFLNTSRAARADQLSHGDAV